jgi:hypothetical protein
MPGFPDFPLSLRGWGNYSLGVSHSNLYVVARKYGDVLFQGKRCRM